MFPRSPTDLTGLAAGWPLNKSCFSDYSSTTRWRRLWRRLQKLGLQSISGWLHLTRTILSSCLEDSDTKQFHLLFKFHQQGMHKASGSLNKTSGNARVRQGEIPLVWEKPQLGHLLWPRAASCQSLLLTAVIENIPSLFRAHGTKKYKGLTRCSLAPFQSQLKIKCQLINNPCHSWICHCQNFASGTWYPTDPMIRPTELILLFSRAVKVALVLLHIFRKSSQQSVTVWEGELHQCPDSSQSCSSEQHKKQSGQLLLLLLSGHPTLPSLVVDSKVLQCSSLLGKGRGHWNSKSVSHFCFSFPKQWSFLIHVILQESLQDIRCALMGSMDWVLEGGDLSHQNQHKIHHKGYPLHAFFPEEYSFLKEKLFANWASTTSASPQRSKVTLILGHFKPTALPTDPIPTAAPDWLSHPLSFSSTCWPSLLGSLLTPSQSFHSTTRPTSPLPPQLKSFQDKGKLFP